MSSNERPQKRYSLFVLALLLLALACIAFVFASNSLAIRSLGLGAIMISVWLIRASNVRQGSNRQERQMMTATKIRRVGMLTWFAGVTSAFAMAAAYLFLRNDAINGYRQALPVYVFSGVGLVFTVIWAYIAAKFLQ